MLKVKQKIGTKLTENMAMIPAASVSGYYFSNFKSKYFGVGKINEDQVKSYSKRKGISINKIEKSLNSSF